MNIEQICAAAKTQSSYLGDPSFFKIYVASSTADPNAARIAELFQSTIGQSGLRVMIFRTGSFGFYDLEPIVIVDRPGLFTILCDSITPEKAAGLIEDLAKGLPGKGKALCFVGNNKPGNVPHISELPLFNLQNRVALRNCGWIDPEDVNHYILRGRGYTGLSKALKMDPADLIETLIPSARKSSGRADFSNAEPWRIFSRSKDGNKCLICNTVDPDPRSLTSRLLLEGDPHSVLEGMLIGAYALGASHCYILVEDQAEAVQRLRKALDQMRMYHLLGSNILDSRFCSEVEIKEVPASLTSGHRIELFRCLEERQPLPHILPDYPDAIKFMGKPILAVDCETMAKLSAVLINGRADRTESKVVTLSGSVVHKRTIEVSPGTTIRSIIEHFGGGILNGRLLKAIQLGGPSGQYVAPDSFDLPIGSHGIEKSGFSISSGSIEVLDADTSMIEAAKDIMIYIQAQSCGKCIFCREGCLQMLTILEDISENKSKPGDLDLLVELGEEMRTSCLCAFGCAAPIPVLSSIKLFRDEYEEKVPSSGLKVTTGKPEPGT